MSEGRAPISSSRVATGDIARHSFAVVRRGFDTDEVRAYLQSISRSIEALEERENELRAAMLEAEERAAHPVVDEATLTTSLGQHSAQILRHAHEEAARIVAQAQESAATMLRETQSQVDELQTRTEASTAERVVEVELLVANAEQEARAQRERILAEAVAEGEAVLASAKEEGRDLLEQVQEARRRVLVDLASRRRTLGIQIEQLRAARDEMAASVYGVRDKVDDILTQLQRTDEEARAAALAAGDQARLHAPAEEPHDQDAPEGPGTGEATVMEVVEIGVDEGAEPAGPGAGSASVDALFARIRAGSGEEAQTGAGEAAPAAAGPDASAADRAEAPAHPEAALIARRDELAAPATARLSRSVKRVLGDDQNRMLDLLRSSPSTPADALLGPEEEHLAFYADAARGYLGEAFDAGTVFAGRAAGSVTPGEVVDQSAIGLARTVVTMLRRRIAEGTEDTATRIGAAFREWRGERVERLTGDFATQAFCAGVIAGAGPGQKVRWVPTSTAGCSDCDDNALAGAVVATEAFPTGHMYPPAHAGCRCLVAPAGD
jgi:DivIVA domain-containing protein